MAKRLTDQERYRIVAKQNAGLVAALKMAAARFEGIRAWAGADGTKFPALADDARAAATGIRAAIAAVEGRAQ